MDLDNILAKAVPAVTDLARHLNDSIDMEYLAAELLRQPTTRVAGGAWRPLDGEEAQKVARIVGEAVGKRWGALQHERLNKDEDGA